MHGLTSATREASRAGVFTLAPELVLTVFAHGDPGPISSGTERGVLSEPPRQ